MGSAKLRSGSEPFLLSCKYVLALEEIKQSHALSQRLTCINYNYKLQANLRVTCMSHTGHAHKLFPDGFKLKKKEEARWKTILGQLKAHVRYHH